MNRHGRRLLRFTLPAMLASALGAASLASAQSLFTATGSLNDARDSHTATRLADGRVLAVAGTNSGWPVASAEIYDPSTGVWTRSAGPLVKPRSLHSATLLGDGKVVIVGGLDENFAPVADVEIYNPSSDRFTRVASLSVGRYYHTATLLADGRVLVVGGYDAGGQPIATAEIFNPSGNSKFSAGIGSPCIEPPLCCRSRSVGAESSGLRWFPT